MQQVVIQRWVNIAGRALSDELQRTFCDPRAVALVVPEGLTIEEIEAQEGRKGKDAEKDNQIPDL
jgi:hypothetical protein